MREFSLVCFKVRRLVQSLLFSIVIYLLIIRSIKLRSNNNIHCHLAPIKKCNLNQLTGNNNNLCQINLCYISKYFSILFFIKCAISLNWYYCLHSLCHWACLLYRFWIIIIHSSSVKLYNFSVESFLSNK